MRATIFYLDTSHLQPKLEAKNRVKCLATSTTERSIVSFFPLFAFSYPY